MEPKRKSRDPQDKQAPEKEKDTHTAKRRCVYDNLQQSCSAADIHTVLRL
jgi:hypothetical protein